MYTEASVIHVEAKVPQVAEDAVLGVIRSDTARSSGTPSASEVMSKNLRALGRQTREEWRSPATKLQKKKR